VAQRVAALIGALLFALHPVQVESVAWVSGTKDVLFGMLSLLAIYEYLQFTQHPPGNRARVHYAVATLAFVLAMLAKPTAMVVPLVVIVLDHFMLGRPLKQVLRSTWPWLVLAVPVMIVTKLSQPAAHATAAAAPILFRPLIAADALAFYFYKLVWPVTLTFDYGRTPQHVIETRAIAWTWIVPALLAVIAWRFRRRAPALAAGLLVGVIVLLPVLGLVAFDFQLYSTVADHYLYLAMLGPALIVAWCVSRRPTTATIVIAACVIAILGVRSFAQTKHWHDSRALFAHGIRVNPASFASYNSLAALAVEERDFPRAVDLSQRALRIRPNHANSHATLAEALRNQGDVDGAITALQAALKYEPDYQPALGNLAVALASRGRFADALRYARRLVELAPDSIPARTNLALIYLDANQPDAARAELEAILRLDPTNEAVRAQLRKLQRP
ncbi:MAG: protein O-mannosyl-transferase, partial [Phycisphaerales bacterium]|nr:protein O-mannosyl-transferase [Phycisphaerales bacterium]